MAAKAIRFTFVTGNKKKLEVRAMQASLSVQEVQAILGSSFPFPVDSASPDVPELQGTPEEISVDKCRIAAEKIGGPTLVEDTSLCFEALGGLPGPYIKDFLNRIGHDGLNRMLAGFDTTDAYAQCIFAMSLGPGHTPMLFVGRTPGKIVPARGPKNFGWDPVFEPAADLQLPGALQTYAEMPSEHKNTISHRYRALDKLRTYVAEHREEIERTLGAKAVRVE